MEELREESEVIRQNLEGFKEEVEEEVEGKMTLNPQYFNDSDKNSRRNRKTIIEPEHISTEETVIKRKTIILGQEYFQEGMQRKTTIRPV